MKRYEAYKPVTSRWAKQLPFYWEFQKIAEVFIERKENNDPIKTTNILSLTNTRGVIPYSDKGNLGNKAKNDIRGYRLAYPGDIVLNSMNVVIGSVGLSQYYGAVSPVYYMLYVRNNTKYNVRYYNYVFQDKIFQGGLNGLGNGILEIRMRIPMSKLKYVCVPVPPRDEQEQIVRYLDWQVSKINRLIAAKRKQIELMKDNLKSAVAKLTTHGIGSHDMCRSEIYWLTEYPSTWHVTKLKYILKKHRREVPPNAELLICSNSGEVTKRGDGKLGLVAASDDIYQGVKTGDLLIHGMDTWHGAIAISNFDGMCTPVVHVCTCREEKRFVAYYLKMMAYTKVFKAISNGVRQNTSDFRSWDKVGDLLICLPDISEQVAIADELDKLTDATKKGIACFERHIEKLVDLRTRLISDVVTGQIDVRGIEIPDDERAEEFAFPDNTEEESEDIADEEE